MQIKKIASFDVKNGASTVRYADLDDGISFFPTDGIINIKSNKVRIAGFGVDANSLYRIDSSGAMYPLGNSNSVFLSNEGLLSSASIGGSSGNNKWILAISDDFGVTDGGTLYAKNANIDGNITAREGQIASYTISGDYLMSTDQQVGLSAGDTSFWAGYNKSDDSYKFKVTKDGAFTATKANISGTISGTTITGGTISGATITGGTISGATLSGTIVTGSDTWFSKLNAQNIQTNSDWATNGLGYNIWTGGIKCSNIFDQVGTSNIDLTDEQVHIYTHYNSNILLSPSYARIQASNGPYVCCDKNGVALYGNANNLQVHADNKVWVTEYDGGAMNTGTVVFSRNGGHTVSFYWGNDTDGGRWHLQTYVDGTYVGNAV